jgi:methionine-rich copper-binding protein CopC
MRKCLFIAALLVQPVGSWAHVFPDHSDPGVGGTVTTAPTQVSIFFDGDIDPVESTIAVKNGDHVQVDKKDSHIDAKDPDELVVSLLPALPAGEYRVEWRVKSLDRHITMGHFSFLIRYRRASIDNAEPRKST